MQKLEDESWDTQNKGLGVAEIRNVQGFLAWEATPASQALSFLGVSRGNHPSILGHTRSRTNPLPQICLCLKFLLAL